MCGEDSLNSTNCLRLDKSKDGFKVSLNTVTRYRQELDLKAVLAVKHN
jgi:hypothetical protein